MPQHVCMARLPAVLGTDHLPLAELCAARLDGELFAIDDGWAPIDEPDLPAFRAMAAAMRAPRALIIERMSAAWVHGACDAPPAVAQFCVPLDARIAVIGDHRAVVREVRIDDGDVVRFGEIHCTSPERTGFDLLRDPTLGDAEVVDVVAVLIADQPSLAGALHDRFDAAVRLPHKAMARRRLEQAEPGRRRRASVDDRAQPSLTR
jgi:hypothetical protein